MGKNPQLSLKIGQPQRTHNLNGPKLTQSPFQRKVGGKRAFKNGMELLTLRIKELRNQLKFNGSSLKEAPQH